MLPLALSPLLFLLPSVAAHGYVAKVAIDNTTYTGNIPNAQPTDSPIRQIDDADPVKSVNDTSMNCGQNAQLAAIVAPANPGSVMQFYWVNILGGNWLHEVGPIMTYMAACDTSTCDKFNGSTAKWFKIDQMGKKPDGNTWYMQDIMNGKPASVTLPTQLAPGDYLVRHEIISLQLAISLDGAEFFPSCTQIHVSGSQTGTPNYTVSFPGAYNDNDPGIFDPNVYTPGAPYIFPGGPVSNLASPADMSGQLSVVNSSSRAPAGNSSASFTNGAGSRAQLTGIARLPLSWVCKFQKRDAPHELYARHPRRVLSFLIACWHFLLCCSPFVFLFLF